MLCITTSSWVLIICVLQPAHGCLSYTDILSQYTFKKSTLSLSVFPCYSLTLLIFKTKLIHLHKLFCVCVHHSTLNKGETQKSNGETLSPPKNWGPCVYKMTKVKLFIFSSLFCLAPFKVRVVLGGKALVRVDFKA